MSGIITALTSDKIEEVVSVVTDAVQATAIYKVFPLFMSIALLWAVWRYYNEGEKKVMGIDTKEVIRLFMLSCFLMGYSPIMGTVDNLMHGIISSFDVETDDSFDLMMKNQAVASVKREFPQMTLQQEDNLRNELTGNWATDQEKIENFSNENLKSFANPDDDESGLFGLDAIDSVAKSAEEIFAMVTRFKENFITILLGGVNYGAMWIVKIVMWTLILGFSLIIRALGPLAICTALVFPSQMKKWFLTYATAKMSILTMAIVETIMKGITLYMTNDIIYGGASLGSNIASAAGITVPTMENYVMIGISITGIVSYCMSFWLTSKYFGTEDAGAMMSKAAGAATMAMSGGISKLGNTMTKILQSSKGNNPQG